MDTETEVSAPDKVFELSPDHAAKLERLRRQAQEMDTERDALAADIRRTHLQPAYEALVAEWEKNGPTEKFHDMIFEVWESFYVARNRVRASISNHS